MLVTPCKLSLFKSLKSLCIPGPAQADVSNKGEGKYHQQDKALKRRQQITLFINKLVLLAMQWVHTDFLILSDNSTILFHSIKEKS